MKKNILFLFLFLSGYLFAQGEARLLRFPTIYNDKIVFTYAGDLYEVSSNGGTARKLTNHVGYEMFAKFSPDGKSLAFTGQYDGNTEVYIMPAEGGIPKRLTFTATLDRDDVSDRMGPNNIVMSWKGNDEIIFRSRMIEFNDWKGQLFSVNKEGSLQKQLPLPRGGFCSYSPDMKKLAYNRIFREFRTWKRYRGGQADDIWIYDFDKKTTVNITNNPAQDIFPMWYGNKIYFISDRDSHLNLYVYNLDTKETKQLTKFDTYDIKFPSMNGNQIVFENAGYIYKYNADEDKLTKVNISLNEDLAAGRNTIVDVSKTVNAFEISPDGNRGLFESRGEIFTVPNKNGATRNLTNTSGVHERNPKWSPDGKYVAYISDASGEDEIYIENQDGKDEPVQVTSKGSSYKYAFYWSPDSKKILWSERNQKLFYVDVESKKITQVDYSPVWEITDYSWSPDSKWITYAIPQEQMMTKVVIYSLDDAKSYPVTDGWYDSGSPVFSSDGKYLYFVSNRTFNPRYGQTEWNHIYLDMSKIYLLTLAKDTHSPFEPKSDETAIQDVKTDKKDVKENKDQVKDIKVDVDGIMNRILEIPGTPGNYWNLKSVGDKIYYIRNTSSEEKPKLYLYELDKRKETELGDFGGFEISANGKKMLITTGTTYSIIDLPTQKIQGNENLVMNDLKVNLDKKAEWKEIFNECWRQMRDYFYAPNMNGVNWQKMKEKYEPLVEYVNHRADLTYIIGEMIGELSIGHAYVGGGDYPKADRVPLGLLGAKVERDEKTGYYKITNILKGQNWNANLRSPLTDIGVDVKEGNYIIAIDNKPLNKVNNIYELLVNKANKQVVITVNSKASKDGAKDCVIIPISNEQPLYYYNWVQNNIEKVSKATDGKVGYIHIPDMGVNGLNEFVKYYYPQLKKEALIIDDRGNGGGNVSPMITERLMRKAAMIDITRNSIPTNDPDGANMGPKVLLLDEFSASDGDIFPYRFKTYGLGKLIGKRSWGGVTGIRNSLPIVDGGYLNKPEFSRFGFNGDWIIEGHGVDPDIIVDNDPALEYEGTDQQLDKAIEEIKKEMKEHPNKIYKVPEYPVKDK